MSQEIATADTSTSESTHEGPQESQIPGRTTLLPSLTSPTVLQGGVVGLGSTNDGVFANLAAKSETGEKIDDELPPVCRERYTVSDLDT